MSEVGSDVNAIPLRCVEGTSSDELGEGERDGGEGSLEECVGLGSSLLLEDRHELVEGGLLVEEGFGHVVDSGDGGSFDGGFDGGSRFLGEFSDFGEGGGFLDSDDTGEDGGTVKSGQIGGSDELEQIGDENDLKKRILSVECCATLH